MLLNSLWPVAKGNWQIIKGFECFMGEVYWQIFQNLKAKKKKLRWQRDYKDFWTFQLVNSEMDTHKLLFWKSKTMWHKTQKFRCFKGTGMQIEKAQINDRLGLSKVSWKFYILTIYNFAVTCPWNLLFS